MSRDFEIYLEDIFGAINRIQAYVQGITRTEFETDQMRFDAIIRNLEVIGEAVKQVPESLRNQYPSVEWRKIAGLRDILIHRYFDVNIELVWEIVQSNIPVLRANIEQMIKERRS